MALAPRPGERSFHQIDRLTQALTCQHWDAPRLPHPMINLSVAEFDRTRRVARDSSAVELGDTSAVQRHAGTSGGGALPAAPIFMV